MNNAIRPFNEYINNSLSIDSFCNEIDIIFKSNFRDTTFYHYMERPMPKITTKIILNLLQNQSKDYPHEGLPNCFALNYIPTDE